MKKIFIVVVFVFVSGFYNLYSGEIANIIAMDMVIFTGIGTALGTGLASPSYIEGGSKNTVTLEVGASWGALVGASIGLCYGIWDVVNEYNTRGIKKIHKKKKNFSFFSGWEVNPEYKITSNFIKIKLTKNF